MKVGVIGSGDVGKRLAGGFASRGNEVILGTRKPGDPDLKKWASSVQGKVTIGSMADAARQGQLVVLAVSGGAALSALEEAGKANLAGKVLIDVTNPLDFSKGMPPSLLVGTTDSNGERIQRAVPTAKVVKAFNTLSNIQMIGPHVKGQPRLELLIAGNDAGAKKQVTEIAKSFGWAGTLDAGGIEAARWLEALVPLWVALREPLHTDAHMFLVARD
jgi:8-hydroxy-5-deazaflavin:NADPH oxidoreductase